MRGVLKSRIAHFLYELGLFQSSQSFQTSFFHFGIVFTCIGHGEALFQPFFRFWDPTHLGVGATEFDVMDEAVGVQFDGFFEALNGFFVGGIGEFSVDDAGESSFDDSEVGESLMPAAEDVPGEIFGGVEGD